MNVDVLLHEAERRLRAAGLTGAQAFDAWVETVSAWSGLDGAPHPAVAVMRPTELPRDLLSLAYERFFPDVFKARHGQYFTPPPIADLLFSRLGDLSGLTALDPTAGGGGLLVHAARAGARVSGIEIDPQLAALARLNLQLAGYATTIRATSFWTAPPMPADLLVANPPFSVAIRDPTVLAAHPHLSRGGAIRSDRLFLELLPDWVHPGGRAAIVLPWTLVANPRLAKVRSRLEAHFALRAVLKLPEGVFRPFGGAAGSAALVWLQRLPAAPGPRWWAALSDPGYDCRSTALHLTDDAERQGLMNGDGWTRIDGWTPPPPTAPTTVGDIATAIRGTTPVDGEHVVVDLADVDRATGQALPRVAHAQGRKVELGGDQVLVSRMRPQLGNVAITPAGFSGIGSSEWIRLTTEHPHVLLHTLRTPTWRAGLPPTTGQTRPRTGEDSVLSSSIRPLPPSALAPLEEFSRRNHEVRRRALQNLDTLQALIDAHQSGELDDAGLESALADLTDEGDSA